MHHAIAQLQLACAAGIVLMAATWAAVLIEHARHGRP